jgi:cysteine desulfuration protein SufE
VAFKPDLPHIERANWNRPMSLLDDIKADFELLDEWEDRYRYLIELGRKLEPLPDAAHTEENKVRGCASQVWVETQIERAGDEPVLSFRGDSDAHIVRGLVCLVLALYSGKSAKEILDTDAMDLFQQLGLTAHLTPQRSNGVRSMVERIKRDARMALAA